MEEKGNISLEDSFSIEDIEKLDKEKEQQDNLYNECEIDTSNYKNTSDYINNIENRINYWLFTNN